MSIDNRKELTEPVPSDKEENPKISSRLVKITAGVLLSLSSVLVTRNILQPKDKDAAFKQERKDENIEFMKFLEKKVTEAKKELLSSGDFPPDLQVSDFEPEEVTTYVVHSLHMQYKAAYIATRKHLIQIGDIASVVMDIRKAATISDRVQYRYQFQQRERDRLNSLPVTHELIYAARNYKKGYKLLPLHPSLYGASFTYDPVEGFLEEPTVRE